MNNDKAAATGGEDPGAAAFFSNLERN